VGGSPGEHGLFGFFRTIKDKKLKEYYNKMHYFPSLEEEPEEEKFWEDDFDQISLMMRKKFNETLLLMKKSFISRKPIADGHSAEKKMENLPVKKVGHQPDNQDVHIKFSL